MYRAILVACLAVLGAAVVCFGRWAEPAGAEGVQRPFAERFHARFPGAEGAVIVPSIPGFWAVARGSDVSLFRDDLSVMVSGDVLSVADGHSVTAALRESLRPRVDVSRLDLADAFAIGKGRRVVYVFSDPDCPFCRSLDPELRKLDDVTVYVFPYPLAGIHPRSAAAASALWCAKDRGEAWRRYEVSGHVPKGPACANPVERNVALGRGLGIVGTPSLVFPDGRVVPGFMTAAQISERLGSAAKGGA